MIKPVGHRVLVLPEKAEDQYKGPLAIPDSAKERMEVGATRGKVIDVGPDAWYDKKTAWAKPGDTVYYVRYSGLEVQETEESTKYRLINDEDILGVIREGE